MKAFFAGTATALVIAIAGATYYGTTRNEQFTTRQWQEIYRASLIYSTIPALVTGFIAHTAIASRDRNPKRLRQQAKQYLSLPSVRNDLTSSTLTDIAAHFINQEDHD